MSPLVVERARAERERGQNEPKGLVLGGLGVAGFHPQASKSAHFVSPEAIRGRSMGVFSVGGNLGMARRFQPHMLCDRQQRIALSGGYGGEGVGASNLGGRTLADLILGRDTLLTRQPWVLPQGAIDQLPRWEPEPLRWLGYNAIINSFVHEDRVLAQRHSAPWRRRWAMGLAGFMEGLMR